MPSTLLDTGPTVALINRADKHHRRAVEWFSAYRGTLLTTDFADASLVWLGRSRRATRIATIDATDFNIYRAYSDRPFRNLF